MAIERIIVHQVNKDRHERSTLHLRPQELSAGKAATKLLDEINKAYDIGSRKAHGGFNPDVAGFPFSALLGKYLDDTRDFASFTPGPLEPFKEQIDEAHGGFDPPYSTQLEKYLDNPQDFVSFTRFSMDLLKAWIDKAPLATGGYMMFILYRDEKRRRCLSVVMLNDRDGTAIDDVSLDIRAITELVVDELHLAARIDIDKWQAAKRRQIAGDHAAQDTEPSTDSSDPYLSFVKGRRGVGATVPRYFRNFLGCDEYMDSQKSTRLLIKVTESYVAKVTRSNALVKRRRLKNIVYDAVLQAHERGEEVDLEDISRALDPQNPKAFHAHANSEESGLSATFVPDPRVIRTLGRMSGSGESLQISFATRVLGNKLRYDKKEKLLIIEAALLPDELRARLEAEA